MEKLYHQFRGLQSVREGSWHMFWAPMRRKKKNAPSTTIINMTVIPIQKWTFPDRKSSHLSRSNSDLDGGGSSSDKGMMVVGVDGVECVAVVVSIFFGCCPGGDSSLAEADMVVMMLCSDSNNT